MKSQASLHPQDAPSHPEQEPLASDSALKGLTDVILRYRLESGPTHSTWIADCGYQAAGQLEIQAGPYTLTQYSKSATAAMKAAERLCSLPTHPAVLRVDAVTSSPSAGHIWYEAAEAGTLADYCRARGQLPLAQVTTVAKALTAALTYLHQQELAYRDLRLEHCVFTVKGELKVLAPDLDLRTSPDTAKEAKKAEDIAACAAILWFCLTGKEPKAQRLRAPLLLSLPQASDALAQTLEDAIDLRANQPSLTDLAALFDLTADSAPLELHLSANESVLSRLPAYTATETEPMTNKPKTRMRRAPKVYGQPQTLNRRSSSRAGISLWKSGKQRVAIALLAAIVLALGACISVFLPWIQDRLSASPQEQAAEETQSQEMSLPTSPATLSPTKEPELQKPSEPVSGISGDHQEVITQQTAELIRLRSQVLSSGNSNRVQDYALPGSELEHNDRNMLTQEGARDLSQMSSQVVSVEEISAGQEGSYTVIAVLEARGYNPKGSDEELARLGMTRDGERIMQKVSLTLQPSSQGLRIESAKPITANEG
ncbi:protein kinase domain-containing protein [Rothia sp. CCM 9416]|uniref:protein kinase domain-containing protein n=1 Tax=Rothia sp. CCM 9416 TaxID=3402655 RepID=UPI003ADF824E